MTEADEVFLALITSQTLEEYMAHDLCLKIVHHYSWAKWQEVGADYTLVQIEERRRNERRTRRLLEC
jgi:hypothetical protein